MDILWPTSVKQFGLHFRNKPIAENPSFHYLKWAHSSGSFLALYVWILKNLGSHWYVTSLIGSPSPLLDKCSLWLGLGIVAKIFAMSKSKTDLHHRMAMSRNICLDSKLGVFRVNGFLGLESVN